MREIKPMEKSDKVNDDKVRSRLFLPWKLFVTYIFITIFANFFGPWEYMNYSWEDKFYVLLYMIAFIFATSIAYLLGIKGKPLKKVSFKSRDLGPKEKKFLKRCLYIAIIIYVIVTIEAYLTRGISFDKSFSIQENISWAYYNSHNSEELGRSIGLTIYILGYAYIYIAMTLGLHRYKQLEKKYRIMVISIFIIAVVYNALFIGSNKIFGDIIIIIISVYLIKFSVYSPKLKLKQIFLAILSISLIIYVFSNLFVNRFLLWGDLNQLFRGIASLNPNHWIFKLFKYNLAVGLSISLFYLSQGYYGLSLTLKQPFVWTMGLGSSFAIKNTIARFINVEPYVYGLTYPERMQMETGWGAFSQWHTIFPWLASDFTFIGAILVMSFFAYIYAVSWKEAILENNYLSIVMFSYLTIMFLYIPANNQIFQTTTTTIAFIIILILWVFYRNDKRDYNNKQNYPEDKQLK